MGAVVGALVVAAIIALLVLWRKRKHNDEDDYYSPHNSPVDLKSEFSSFRNPYPQPKRLVDPRLNPTMLGDPRISIASLADARDYSRQVLTVTNPDEKI